LKFRTYTCIYAKAVDSGKESVEGEKSILCRELF